MAGVVTARGPQPGEVVSAGRMIIQVARDGARDAVFDVPAQIKDSAPLDPEVAVTPGNGAKAEPAARRGRPDIAVDDERQPRVTAKGRVREVSPRADPVTGTFAVRVRLIDPPRAMRLGSTVTGRIQLDAVERHHAFRPRRWCVPTARRRCGCSIRRPAPSSLRNIAVRASDASDWCRWARA